MFLLSNPSLMAFWVRTCNHTRLISLSPEGCLPPLTQKVEETEALRGFLFFLFSNVQQSFFYENLIEIAGKTVRSSTSLACWSKIQQGPTHSTPKKGGESSAREIVSVVGLGHCTFRTLCSSTKGGSRNAWGRNQSEVLLHFPDEGTWKRT